MGLEYYESCLVVIVAREFWLHVVHMISTEKEYQRVTFAEDDCTSPAIIILD